MQIRDRIVGLRRVKASELRPNPKNWRTHPKRQQEALRGILAEIGYSDALIARETETGLELIDGHRRGRPRSPVPRPAGAVAPWRVCPDGATTPALRGRAPRGRAAAGTP